MSAFVAITLSCAKSTISWMMMGPSYYRLLASVLHGNIMISFGTSSQSDVDQPSVLKVSALRSNLLTSSASTTQLLFGDGTRTGSQTRTRLLKNTEGGG